MSHSMFRNGLLEDALLLLVHFQSSSGFYSPHFVNARPFIASADVGELDLPRLEACGQLRFTS